MVNNKFTGSKSNTRPVGVGGGFRFKKKLGQNFLVDTGVTHKITQHISNVRSATIIEIGPGSGALTTSLLECNPAELIIIEIDQDLLPHLKDLRKLLDKNFQIVHADALQISEESLTEKRFKIVSNLPYNIGTALIIKWLHNIHLVDEIIVMLQREVAERIVANKSSKAYGRISVLAQSLCHCEKLFDVSPHSFYPQPKVTSSVVRLKPKENLLSPLDVTKLEKACKALFNYRRKKITTYLKKDFPNIESILCDLLINVNARAESLSIKDFYNLSQKINFR